MILVLQKLEAPDDFGQAIAAIQVSFDERQWECSDFLVRISRIYPGTGGSQGDGEVVHAVPGKMPRVAFRQIRSPGAIRGQEWVVQFMFVAANDAPDLFGGGSLREAREHQEAFAGIETRAFYIVCCGREIRGRVLVFRSQQKSEAALANDLASDGD